MFELLKSASDGSDCICNYDVQLDEEYTTKEFIDEMISTNVGNWGYITINNNKKCIEQLKYCADGTYYNPLNPDCKIKKVYASGYRTRMDYYICIENQTENVHETTKGSLRFIVKKPNGEESVVVIFRNKSDGAYSFVNLTKEHICSCKFKTIEEAIQDMNDRLRKGLIESYIVKGERNSE